MERFLAIDIGGTSMKYALVCRDGTIQPLGSLPTGAAMTRAQLEAGLAQAVDRVGGAVQGIGVSTLGFVHTQNGRICGGVENMPCLEDFSPGRVFGRLCPDVPVNVVNDAVAAALGEQRFGAAAGIRSFFCAAFGTGIGGCAVLNGVPWQGSNFRAGEIGYWNDGAADVCWEQHGSAVALFRQAGQRLGMPALDGSRFFALLASGNPVCRELFAAWTRKTGSVFANIVLLLDVDCILVGGGISAQGKTLTRPLQQAMEEWLPPGFRGRCRVIPAALGNHAALLGAVSPLLG